MVYDWEGKRDICYRMYIEEKKPLEQIMEYMKVFHQFPASKRAYQTQFKRWGFPSKQNPAHRNEALVARIKALWECNTTQRDMLRILHEEGFNIKERELMRVRAKNRWLLRVPNGMKGQLGQLQQEQATPEPTGTTSTTATLGMEGEVTTPSDPDASQLLALQQETYKVDDANGGQLGPQPEMQEPATVTLQQPSMQTRLSPELTPEVIARRKERLEKLQAESREKWATRKRRRRTRGWAGLPADPPGPPRFPSETTIDEAKQYLRLDNDTYREIRDHFQRICEEGGFLKKTVAGEEKWQAAKDRLVSECPHLQAVMWGNAVQLKEKALALDVLCTDVTKRMRTQERRMTIAEAKNALGINPEESRQIRYAFYNILKADHFTSKLEAGEEHWNELKQRWIKGSELLQRILAAGEADPQHALKLRAVEVLCRDVMKRLRDDQAKRDPARKRSGQITTKKNKTYPTPSSAAFRNGISNLASQALARAPMVASDIGDMQIDPSLLQAAANDPAFGLHQVAPATTNAATAPSGTNSYGYVDPMLHHPNSALSGPIPIYLRIRPDSPVYHNSKMWLDKLSTRTVSELKQLVLNKFKHAVVARIDGIEKAEDGQELLFLIEEDDQLDAYLTHMQGRQASFTFLIRPA
ncbi:hypothetical protein VTO42DRAFT_3518 [Malbranchea cinnamomea]